MFEESVVVIDNGSDRIKAGLAGDNVPRVVFPTLLGTLKFMGSGGGDFFIGNEALAKRAMLLVSSPIQCGHIVDSEGMEKIWHHTFHNELDLNPEEHAVLLTENGQSPKLQRETTAQIMFEKFGTPALYFANTAVLSLRASNLQTGIVVESGDGATNCVPILDGSPVPKASRCLGLAGYALTDVIPNILTERGCSFPTANQRQIARDIKEKHFYVSQDYGQQIQDTAALKTEFELPDGEVVTIDQECIRVPEMLFQPSLNGLDYDGLHKTVHDSIMECDEAIRQDMYANIVLSGGTSMFRGLADRLKKEVAALAAPNTTVEVIASPEREFSAWIGGSKMAAQPTFKELCITKMEYQESGPSIVHTKCS